MEDEDEDVELKDEGWCCVIVCIMALGWEKCGLRFMKYFSLGADDSECHDREGSQVTGHTYGENLCQVKRNLQSEGFLCICISELRLW